MKNHFQINHFFQKNFFLASRLAYEQPGAGDTPPPPPPAPAGDKQGEEKRISDLMSQKDKAENEKKSLLEQNQKLLDELTKTNSRLSKIELTSALNEKIKGKEYLLPLLKKMKEPTTPDEIDALIISSDELYQATKKDIEESIYDTLKLPGASNGISAENPIAKSLQKGTRSGLVEAIRMRME